MNAKLVQVQHLIPSALKAEEVRKICTDFQFDQEKIDEYLSCYEIEEKYKDLEAFQWHQTKTRDQKNQDRKLKRLNAERERLRRQHQEETRKHREERRAQIEERKA